MTTISDLRASPHLLISDTVGSVTLRAEQTRGPLQRLTPQEMQRPAGLPLMGSDPEDESGACGSGDCVIFAGSTSAMLAIWPVAA